MQTLPQRLKSTCAVQCDLTPTTSPPCSQLVPLPLLCRQGPIGFLRLPPNSLTSGFSVLASFYSGYHTAAKLKCWLFSKDTFSFVSEVLPILFSLPVTLFLSPPVSVNFCCTTNLPTFLPAAGSVHVSGFQQEEESRCTSTSSLCVCHAG